MRVRPFTIADVISALSSHTATGSKVNANWIEGQGCFVAAFNSHIVVAAFIFTMCFDLAVLALAAGKLAFGPGKRTRLMNLMFKDGIVFFVIVYVLPLSYSP